MATTFVRHCATWLAAFGLLLSAGRVDAEPIDEVQQLQAAGRSADALRKVDEFLVAQPRDPQLRFMKAVLLADAKQDREAIVVLERLTEDFPNLAEPYNNLAALHAAAGDHDKARAALEQALRRDPRYATAHENLGDVYAALAAKAYASALELEPSRTGVTTKLAALRAVLARPSPSASVPARATQP